MAQPEVATKILCNVYRSRSKSDLYLFVHHQRGLATVPDQLLAHFGKPEQVMTLALSPQSRLARAKAADVLAALAHQGYYLQMPPSPDVGMAAINARNEKLPRG